MPVYLWIFLLVFAVPLPAAVVFGDFPIDSPVWWVTSSQAPDLSIRGPRATLRGQVDVYILLQPADRARVVSATIDGQPLKLPSMKVALDTGTLPDGEHTLSVIAEDSSLRHNRATAEWHFVTRNAGPALDVAFDPPEGPHDGKTFVVRVSTQGPVSSVSGSIAGRTLRFQPGEAGAYWALDGTSPGPADASLDLVIRAVDDVGNATTLSRDLALARTTFAEDNLELTPDLAKLITADSLAREEATFDDLYRQDGGPRRWEGLFRRPVAGTVTTEFGTHRSYEYHPGADFGVALGTPVVAPAAGVVARITRTTLRGNVLVVDHGAGVYSAYAHLQDTKVVVGQKVRPGDLIAHVGNSGLSTGPHLHWELRVNGSDVDPFEWTQRAFP